MKKLIILSLILLFSCGKDSSVHDNRKTFYPKDIIPGDDYGYYYYGNHPDNYWTEFEKFRNHILTPNYTYWGLYPAFQNLSFKKMYFYYTSYSCNGLGGFYACFTNQHVKTDSNIYHYYSSPTDLRHVFGTSPINRVRSIITQDIINQTNFADYVSFDPQSNTWFVSHNGGWYGFNNGYPLWANPVYIQEGGNIYMLSYIWVDF